MEMGSSRFVRGDDIFGCLVTMYRLEYLARRFGAPQPLLPQTIADTRAAESGAEDWWWFYTAEVGAPRRSAAGL